MALNATLYKLQLAVSDIDRHHYAEHALTLAQHPSETVDRLLVRMLAFLFDADDRLQMTRGLSSSDEPDLWRHSDSGEIEHWIELGLPDAQRLKKASHRAQRVTLYCYGERKTDVWWQQNQAVLGSLVNLAVVLIPAEPIAALQSLLDRHMKWQATLQDNTAWVGDAGGSTTVTVTPLVLQAAAASRWH